MSEISRRTALEIPLLAAALQRYRTNSAISSGEREEALRQAEASLRLSGLKIDSKVRRIFERYVSGEITLAGMGGEIDALHERELGFSACGEYLYCAPGADWRHKDWRAIRIKADDDH